jgi:large subunit ribosomal protein L23
MNASAKPAQKPAKKSVPKHVDARLTQVLVAPIISEKATRVAEKNNQVRFKVLRVSTKPEIKTAVELLFKVEVASVQVVNHKGKSKRFGRSMGRRDHVRKAYVCLKPGQELNFSGEAA